MGLECFHLLTVQLPASLVTCLGQRTTVICDCVGWRMEHSPGLFAVDRGTITSPPAPLERRLVWDPLHKRQRCAPELGFARTAHGRVRTNDAAGAVVTELRWQLAWPRGLSGGLASHGHTQVGW